MVTHGNQRIAMLQVIKDRKTIARVQDQKTIARVHSQELTALVLHTQELHTLVLHTQEPKSSSPCLTTDPSLQHCANFGI